MKKILCVITALVLVLGIVTGCSQNSSKNNAASNSAATSAGQNKENETTTEAGGNAKEQTTSEAVTDDVAGQTIQEQTSVENVSDTSSDGDASADNTSGKTIVVYYSASGSTRRVAETIADTLGADIFEITPVEPYSNADLNWTDNDSRVSREHNDVSLRDVELTQIVPENWDSYDTVLIGYPIWWAIAAWPVDNFVKENDFTGKTVIPFCTSASSGLGESGNLLADMAGTGNWLEGHRFTSGASASDVQKWVESLNIGQ